METKRIAFVVRHLYLCVAGPIDKSSLYYSTPYKRIYCKINPTEFKSNGLKFTHVAQYYYV